MREQLEQIKTSALAAIREAADLVSLDSVRVNVLGKKGELTAVLFTHIIPTSILSITYYLL